MFESDDSLRMWYMLSTLIIVALWVYIVFIKKLGGYEDE